MSEERDLHPLPSSTGTEIDEKERRLQRWREKLPPRDEVEPTLITLGNARFEKAKSPVTDLESRVHFELLDLNDSNETQVRTAESSEQPKSEGNWRSLLANRFRSPERSDAAAQSITQNESPSAAGGSRSSSPAKVTFLLPREIRVLCIYVKRNAALLFFSRTTWPIPVRHCPCFANLRQGKLIQCFHGSHPQRTRAPATRKARRIRPKYARPCYRQRRELIVF